MKYRKLRPNDILRKCDEYKRFDSRGKRVWRKTIRIGEKVGEFGPYRRPIKPKKKAKKKASK